MAASNLPRGARFADTCNDTAPEPAATRQSVFFGGIVAPHCTYSSEHLNATSSDENLGAT